MSAPRSRLPFRQSAVLALLGCLLITACQPGAAGPQTGSGPTRTPTAAASPTAGPIAEGTPDDPTSSADPSTPDTPPATTPQAAPSAVSSADPTTPPSTARPPTTPPTTTPAPGTFPNAANTGVPAGTALSPFTGSCTITTANTVIDSKSVNCDLDIRAANVTISQSKINGRVLLDTDVAGSSAWSYTLQDSEVDAGTVQLPAVSYGNMTVLRSDVHGGQTAVQCGEKASFCTVRDSWLHGQKIPQGANWHLGGFLSNGGTNVLIQHNTVVCDARPTGSDGGCTGDVNLFGDFAVVSHVTVDGNFMGASTGLSYCTFGGDVATKAFPHADHVVYRNNVFQRGGNGKCGDFGPVADFNVSGPGNKWIGNRWEDGPPVPPAM